MSEILAAANLIITSVLAVLTGVYVLLTKRLAEASARQASLTANPIVMPRINRIHIGERFGPGRQQMNVECCLANVGNATAINVFADAELQLVYAEKDVCRPARFDPEFAPFIKEGGEKTIHMNFGNLAVSALLADLGEAEQRNFERIKSDPTREAHITTSLKLSIYYSNSINSQFKVTYEVRLGVWNEAGGWKLPDRDEDIDLKQFYIPKPKLTVHSIRAEVAEGEIEARDRLRDLSGW